MEASKSFIKNAVGILIVVAMCLVAVTIYKKGNDSINDSVREYDRILAEFEDRALKKYENTTVQGSQIIDLLKNMEERDGLTVYVSNGYTVQNKLSAQEYDYRTIYCEEDTVLDDISDKNVPARYINSTAVFASDVMYDENEEITAVIFKQK